MASQGLAIVVRGSTDVHISAVRITATNATYTYTNGILEIAGENGTTVIARNVSFVSSANGTCIINNTVCMHGMTVELRDGQLVLGGRVPAVAIVHGRRVELGAAPAPPPAVDFTVPRDRRVISLCVDGGADVRFADGMFADGELAVGVRGPGDVHLGRNRLARIRATVTGSGEIRGAVDAGTASLVVTGPGDIGGVHARASIEAVCTGSGEVRATAAPNASVSKSLTGSGRITIKKTRE